MCHEVIRIKKFQNVEDKIKFSQHNDIFLQNKIEEYINYPPVSEWFDTKWEVLNERSIIEDNNIYILDRVLLSREETIVIDFKFGDFKEDHIILFWLQRQCTYFRQWCRKCQGHMFYRKIFKVKN